jgi:hypothetical protein
MKSTLATEKTATEQWQELVKEAEAFNGVILDEELESYLVFLLMRYMQKPEMVARVLALDYLNGSQTQGSERSEAMRDVGDQCLLFSGLFPNRARRRNVKVSYYVTLGQSAYHHLSGLTQAALSSMYDNLARSFVDLMDTLLAIRNMQTDQTLFEPIIAFELWQDTRSKQARQTLGAVTSASCLDIKPARRH